MQAIRVSKEGSSSQGHLIVVQNYDGDDRGGNGGGSNRTELVIRNRFSHVTVALMTQNKISFILLSDALIMMAV